MNNNLIHERPLIKKPRKSKMKYHITDTLLHIDNSYLIDTKEDMCNYLEDIKFIHPESKVFNRSMRSLTCEWKGHNRLYKLGLFKDHTKDVDLESDQKWYFKIIWAILGM